MIFEFLHVSPDLPLSQGFLEFPSHHHPGQGPDNVKHDPHPGEDEDHGIAPPCLVQRMNLSITHSGQGDDRHVEGVKKTPALNNHITKSPQDQKGRKANAPEDDFFKFWHPGYRFWVMISSQAGKVLIVSSEAQH
jgi:hypothetical protein